ncbi:MAG: glycosyltransferase family 39 protein [Elusimicrobia bacterium]|nr:glycosyltransferase family 39 protein [Elusimicrobiota bacterium]
MKSFWARRVAGPAAVLFSWGLFLILSHRLWPYQGVFIGEAQGGAAAYAWIHQISGAAAWYSSSIGEWSIPLMYNTSHGPWGIYLLAPFVALGGCTLASLRCYSAFMFLFALWGTWWLAFLTTKSETAALLAAMLLAICPAMAVTRSEYVSAPDAAASVWALCFALSYVRTRKPGYAWAASAAFFLGLCTRTWVAGLGVGLALYAILAWRGILALLPESDEAKARLLGVCLALAGIFMLPILAWNATHSWFSAWFYAHNLIRRGSSTCGQPGHGSCSNLAYWTNLKFNVHQLASLCDGTARIMVQEPWHWLYAAPLLISLIFTVRNARRRGSLWSASAALWIIALGYFLAAAMSPTTQDAIHLGPLVPILAVLAASWIVTVPIGWPRAAAAGVMALVCAAQFTGDVWLFQKKYVDISSAGVGWYGTSPLIVGVSRWAGEQRIPIIPLSQPFADAAPYFSQGRAILIPRRDWISSDRYPWKEWLLRKDRPYFLTENDSLGAAAAAELKNESEKWGVSLARVKVFRDSLNRPAFVVYRVR